jgi:hypothetical protein
MHRATLEERLCHGQHHKVVDLGCILEVEAACADRDSCSWPGSSTCLSDGGLVLVLVVSGFRSGDAGWRCPTAAGAMVLTCHSASTCRVSAVSVWHSQRCTMNYA